LADRQRVARRTFVHELERTRHPGEVLEADFLTPMKVTRYRLAKDIGVPQTRIAELCHGRRSISADTALRLAKYFNNDPRYWLGLQNDFDLAAASRTSEQALGAIQSRAGAPVHLSERESASEECSDLSNEATLYPNKPTKKKRLAKDPAKSPLLPFMR
jgi:antitoxin HigA-1